MAEQHAYEIPIPSNSVAASERAATPGAIATSSEPRLQLTALQNGKPLVRWFLSYAHADGRSADQLRQKLILQLGNSSQYAFDAWTDRELLPGEAWFEQIDAALQAAHVGVLLVSHAFLASSFIVTKELPAFLRGNGQGVEGKRVVPVLLEPVDFGITDMKGLSARQLYMDGDGKAFAERRGPKLDQWVTGLVRQLHALLDRYALVESTNFTALQKESRNG